jgi:hypothetical protein
MVFFQLTLWLRTTGTLSWGQFYAEELPTMRYGYRMGALVERRRFCVLKGKARKPVSLPRHKLKDKNASLVPN